MQNIWVLENGQPQIVKISIGDTDGQYSQVTGGQLQPGSKVIVDTISQRKRQ
jgi:hypothetical protein